MRFVDRSKVSPPQFLVGSPEVMRLRGEVLSLFEQGETKRAQTSLQKGAPNTFLSIADEMTSSLTRLFQGRCAFCEGEAHLPYMFRPATEAEPVKDRATSHLYYAWLETSWDNWLLICQDCQPRNAAHFPVRGKRMPLPDGELLQAFAFGAPSQAKGDSAAQELFASWSDCARAFGRETSEANSLLDPTVDKQIYRHLHVEHDGTLVGLTERGSETIQHFNLKRPDLVEQRAKALAELIHWLESSEMRDRSSVSDISSLQQLPMPGVSFLRLRFLVRSMARNLSKRVSLQADQLSDSFDKLLSTASGPAVWDRMREASYADMQEDRVVKSSARQSVPSVRTDSRVRSVSISNFKSIENLKLDIPAEPADSARFASGAETGSLLILGENACGKSTILEAGSLAFVDERVRDALALKPKRLVLDPRFMDAETSELPRSEAVIEAKMDDGSSRTLRITADGFEGLEGDPPLLVFAYGAFRQYMEKSRKRRKVEQHVVTLFRSNELLPNPTPWLLSLAEDKFSMVARSLRYIFAVEGEIDVIQRGDDDCYIIAPYEIDSVQKFERTPLDLVSSGFRAILAMACDIMRGLMDEPGFQTLRGARALVFIDEIEAHLHPRWKIAIMSALRRALPNVTFIVTSHDPLCLRGMGTGEVMVLNRVRGDTTEQSDLPVFIETISTLPNIEELTIEQLLTADFFQLNSTDSHALEVEYARIADLLHKRSSGRDGSDMAAEEKEALRAFGETINRALPVGNTEIQRLVQEAVAEYLHHRPKLADAKREKLRQSTKEKIIRILGQA